MGIVIGDGYKPSPFMLKLEQDGKLRECRGLSDIVREAKAAGYRVFIDLGDGECYLEEVTPENVRHAVHEVDEATINFVPTEAGARGANMLVIAGNDEDWLVDYSYVPWLDRLVHEHAM